MNKKFLQMAICISTAMLLCTGCDKKSTVNYISTTVEKTDIRTSITATGTIEPVTKVEVGTQVSGIIAKIYVDYNSQVKKGDLMAVKVVSPNGSTFIAFAKSE